MYQPPSPPRLADLLIEQWSYTLRLTVRAAWAILLATAYALAGRDLPARWPFAPRRPAGELPF